MSQPQLAPAISPPADIPDHELVCLIGRGSYGAVWLARNMMGSYRAVKIVYRNTFSTERPFARELEGLRRFEPISRLHEGFIDVLHLGQDAAGTYFYQVMELGDDQRTGQQIDPEHYLPKTLASEVSRRGRLPVPECLQLGLSLATALHHLHQHGFTHRDIKPSNIILVNGAPKLADVGLVAEIGAKQTLVGTEGFFPPEGLVGTPQADVYALGKVLYEISTGRDRLEFPDLAAGFEDFPDHIAFLEFNEVVSRACHGEPAKRYESALDMQAELAALLNGKSLKRLRLLEKRWASLKKIAAVTAMVLLAALIAGGFAYWHWKQSWEARQMQLGANIANGTSALNEGRLVEALPFFIEALRYNRGDSKREETDRLRCGTIFAQCPKLIQMWRHPALINCATFSPDGQRVLIVQQFKTAQVWDVATGAPASPAFARLSGVETAFFSHDGRRVVTADQDSQARVWDAATGEELLRLPHPHYVFGARFSPDGQRVVTASSDGLGRVWDARTGQLLAELKGHTESVLYAVFSPDGRLIATSSADRTARLWNSATGAPQEPSLIHPSWVYHAAFSPDGQHLVTSCYDGRARVWDVAKGQELLRSLPHGDTVRSAEYSPDGRFILTASLDSLVRIWDAATLHPVKTNPVLKQSARVMYATFAPDGHRVVTACTDGSTRIWDLAANEMMPHPIPDCFSLDGRRFLTTTNGWLQLWDAASGRPLSPGLALAQPVQSTRFTDNGKFLLVVSTASQDRKQLQVWDTQSGQWVSTPIYCANPLGGAVLSPDGRHLATFTDVRAQLWNARTGEPLTPVITNTQPVTAMVFSPDARRVLLVSDNFVHIRDADSGAQILPPLAHPLPVTQVAFSPDSRRIVTCYADPRWTECAAQVWNAATGKSVGQPLRHRDGVLYATFSPRGRRVATASEDFTAIIWDAATGRQLTLPLKHEHQVNEAAFSPDGRWLATASADRSIRIWDAATGEALSPPLRCPWNLKHAVFNPNATQVLAAAGAPGHAWVWDLPRQDWPLEDLLRLAQVFSAQPALNLDGTASDTAARTAAAFASYQYLKARHPGSFATSRAEILAWHEQAAQAGERDHDAVAACFHLRHLLALEPDNSQLARRYADAQRTLATAQPTN